MNDKVSSHIFHWNRCIFCNTNDLDEDVYGPFECIERDEVYVYSTSTVKLAPEDDANYENNQLIDSIIDDTVREI